MNKVIVVCGPTASGKTSLSISLAKKFDAEIVSADSMQIYKEMNIGTAKPDEAEKDGILHHMMDVVSVCDDYNVSLYKQNATRCIDAILSRGKNAIIAGGTGLYIDSLINNVDFFEFENDFEYRKKLTDIATEQGGEVLVDMLMTIDPQSALRLHKNDIKRLVRALEVYKVTGKTLTELHALSKQKRKYDPVFVGLKYTDRQILYDRINRRVDLMMDNGFLDEAKFLISLPLSSTASAAIGYSDLFLYINGEISLDSALENIKQKSRNYAKRQLSWFNRNEEIEWFFPDNYENFECLISDVCEYVSSELR